MTMEMKRKYPFSVDTWTKPSKRKPHHFLTHAHKDHTAGIECHSSHPIYCSPMTRRIMLRRHPKLQESLFQSLEIAEPKLIPDDEQPFTVTAFDANHCPGSIMLLFEGNFGKVLHTGDCRLTIDCLNKLPPQFVSKGGALDCLYLDCTFGKEAIAMPSREDAIQQVIRCIWNNPSDSNVNLACDLLGQEEIFHAISEAFGMKIYIDKTKLREYAADLGLVAPELLTTDKESTRFHICEGFPRLFEKARLARIEARVRRKPEPLFIRPSAQWYTYEERLEGAGSGLLSCISTSSSALHRTTARRQRQVGTAPTEAEKDEYGVWHVCFSMHSSRNELETALKILNPNQVVSTTPHCGANDVFPSKYQGIAVDDDLPNIRAVVVAPHLASPKMCVLETHERRKGKIDYTCSPVKRKRDEDSPDRPLPLFGYARYGVALSPPLSFPSPCRQSSKVETVVTKHASIFNPLTILSEIPDESGNGSGTQMLKSLVTSDVSIPHIGDGIQDSYSQNPLSPRNANVRRSKRLFGGTSSLKMDISDENRIYERIESVSVGNSLSCVHEDETSPRGKDSLAVKSSRFSMFSRTVRMPKLAPLPSLLDYL